MSMMLCAFCESLPQRHPEQAVRNVRCPLCRTEVGVTAGGVKFRPNANATAPPIAPRHGWLARVRDVLKAVVGGTRSAAAR